ncbi:Vacuolar protein sorting-associated protein 13C, partial [Ophiophagus hannah]
MATLWDRWSTNGIQTPNGPSNVVMFWSTGCPFAFSLKKKTEQNKTRVGNVSLDNLLIKENALSELDVPFRVKAGQIGIKYDAEKEEKYLQDNKQKELSRIEEALQKSAEKDKPKEQKKDTFLEKLATQVIKNVQVKITGIHIKYEDDITDPKRPISLGMTLAELSLQTTNENWTPCILNEAARIIYKVQLSLGSSTAVSRGASASAPLASLLLEGSLALSVAAPHQLHLFFQLLSLDSLSVYWNVESEVYYRSSREQILEQLKKGVPSMNQELPGYQYIFKPISASAKLYLNPHAEEERETPKVDCAMEVQSIAVELTKPQYLSMIDLLESIDYMVRNAPYRKYRPEVSLHGNAQQWWKYAGNCILDLHIKRYTQMWSWNHIKSHKQLLKSYKNIYKLKLTQTKLSEENQKQIQDLEKALDVFNIVLARQQAQTEVVRSGQKLSKKSADGEKKSGWFSGFWGRKESRKKADEEDKSVPESKSCACPAAPRLQSGWLQRAEHSSRMPVTPSTLPAAIDDLMTPEEKAKLFTAIGYSNSSHNLALPKTYVAHVVSLKLLCTSVTIKEDRNVPDTLKIQIIDLSTKISQRPGAQALKIEAKLEHWYMTGLRQQDVVPSLVASIGGAESSLLEIKFETNPGDSVADQSLFVQSQPVEIIYDARTINALVEFFQTNRGMDLERLTTATLSKLEEIKERTATGLMHIIETRKVLDLRVNLKPSYLLIPQTGFHHEQSNLLILDLGTFQAPAIPVVSDGRKDFLGATLLLEELESESEDEYFDSEDYPQQPEKAVPPPKKQLKIEAKTVQEELTDLQLKFEIKEASVVLFSALLSNRKRDSGGIVGEWGDLAFEEVPLPPTLPQTPQVTFSSLQVVLHTQALLSALGYLMAVIPAREKQLPALQRREEETQKTESAWKEVAKLSKDKDVFNFKFFAKMEAFCLNVCDEKNNIAEIKVQGLDSFLFLQSSQTILFARLKDVVVIDVDSRTIHRKAVSIVGDEVFSFNLALYPDATEGEAYMDMSKVDGTVALKVGCIQIIYLHKFLMSLLNFLSNFQIATEALSAATVQAAEKAATSMRDFAQRSFRLSMDINLKAPVIVVPQSSVSCNAVVFDLGLIKIQNQFSLVPVEDCSLPPIVDKMEVHLTQLKLSRTILQRGASQPDIQILHPINLELSVSRNLAGMWYHKIPLVEVRGYLDTIGIILSQEDLNVLLKVMNENLAEADKNDPGAEPSASTEGKVKETVPSAGTPKSSISEEALKDDRTSLLLNFEINKVVVTLTKQVEKQSFPLYRLTVLKLGSEGRVKMHDMTLTAYLKKVQMNCLEFTDSKGDPLNIISSSDESGKHLLKMEYVKAAVDGPHFDTVYNRTKQLLNVSFSSLDLLLHTEALLSIMHFFTSASSGLTPAEKGADVEQPPEDPKRAVAESDAAPAASPDDVFDLKLMAKLNAFNILVCDQKADIADIRIQGMEACVFTTTKHTEVFARLRDFIITNVDPETVHKKHFLNHFQTAKEALSAATLQAAEKATSSVKDFAQKSFRLSMDINLKAPVILIPQSSVSNDVLVADLGLIRVWNEFTLVSGEEEKTPPPVIDKMDIQLTQLKISRTVVGSSPQPDVEILQPVNLQLSVQRNLASDWYLQIPGIAIQGDLKAMLISLSQDDLTLVMNILLENLSEAVADPKVAHTTLPDAQKFKKPKAEAVAGLDEGAPEIPAEEALGEAQVKKSVALMFHFNFESLSIVLYNGDKNQKSQLSLHNSHLRLGELRLHFMSSSGQMFSDGSLDVSTKMETCTLDDLREGVEKATARMLARKDGKADSVMIDINYKQNKNGSDIVAVLDQLYLCASMEFLLTVADFFVQSVPAAKPAEKPAQFSLKPASQGKPKPEKAAAAQPNMSVVANILDPEIVFVANLTKADAPALAASFQCSFMLSGGSRAQQMTARVLDLRVLACPFLRGMAKKDVTTVVHPCSLAVEATMDTSGVQSVDVNMDTLIVKRQDKEEESGGILCNPVDLWSIKSIDECQSWFLGIDVATEATEALLASEQSEKKEHFKVEVKSVQVTLECGLGHRTVPLLLAESTFSGTVKNWSSLMSARADLTLEVNYYNESHALWEPLIEQVDREGRRWNLKLEMKTNPEQDRGLLPGDDFIILPEPQQLISISSKDTMNITMSKCCLTVLNNLAKGFSEGTTSTYDATLKDRAPFTVRNALGIPVRVHTCRSLRVVGFPKRDTSLHELGLDQSLELEYATSESLDRRRVSILHRQDSSLLTLSFGPEGYNEVSAVPIAKPGRRLHSVREPQSSSSNSVVVQIDAEEGNKVITLRSPLQVNHGVVILLRCQLYVQPTGILKGQYEPSTTYISWQEELHRSSEVTCMLQCPATDISFLPLRLKATAEPDELNFIATHKENWEPAYIIHFYPTLILQNLLPYSLQYILEGMAKAHELHEGSTADVLHSRISGELLELILLKYQGRDWNGHIRVHDALPEFFPLCFTSQSTEMVTMDLYVHVRKASTHTTLSVYSPYWIINKTSRVLQYRAEDVHVKHPADFRDTILFSFKKKNIFSKNKIQLCISTSTWSSNFSLDTVGNSGCVKCPAGNMDFLVGVTIQMSSFNLTRIVTLTPFYTIANTSSLELEFGEMGADGSFPTNKWNYFSPSECVAFWPESLSGKLCIRVSGSEQFSKPFFYNRQDNGMLLSLEKMNTGILVNVSVAEHSVVINVSDYYEGAAPALVINQTSWATLKYQQSGLQEVMELKPKEVRLFVWADPTGTRKLSWNYAQNTGELDLLKDECGQFSYNANTPIHWVSFLDGRQRVLLFTEDVALVSKARQAEEMEQPDQEDLSAYSPFPFCSSGIVWELKPKQRWKPFNQKHISLLEQVYQRHISVQSTEPSGWIKINNNFEINFDKVPMEMRLPFKCIIKRDFLSAIQIEFKQSAHQKSLRAQLYWLQVEPKPFIDVSIIVRFNEYSKVLQFKYFMVLVQEMAVKLDQGFLAAVIDLFTPATDPEAEKQKTGLIQKDIDALNTELLESSLTDVSTPSFFEHFHISPLKACLLRNQVSVLQKKRIAVESHRPLQGAIPEADVHPCVGAGCPGQPLRLNQRPFGRCGGPFLRALPGTAPEHRGAMVGSSKPCNLVVWGAAFPPHQILLPKCVFKRAVFQTNKLKTNKPRRRGIPVESRLPFTTSVRAAASRATRVRKWSQPEGCLPPLAFPWVLQRGAWAGSHGAFSSLFQGLSCRLSHPQPRSARAGAWVPTERLRSASLQGAVQGPEECAEGFVIGVRSLLGHTVGGAAGVVSRITGSVGKGLAAITMDKEFQQKRREEMGRQPKDLGDSLAKGGKGFLRGVVGGVTGIVTKPVEGAKKEGAAGFFKGIGKGLVGVVARPTGGIIDMASSTFQGIQRKDLSLHRVAESTEEVSSLRPPRLIREDGIIRPYDRGEADGCDLFENSHIKKLEAESFQHYCPVPGRGKAYIVVTSRRVILMKEVEILGHMTTDWDYLYEDFTQRSQTDENLLQLFVKDKGILPFPKKESSGQELIKKIRLQDAAAAKRMCQAINVAGANRHQQTLVKQASLKRSASRT